VTVGISIAAQVVRSKPALNHCIEPVLNTGPAVAVGLAMPNANAVIVTVTHKK